MESKTIKLALLQLKCSKSQDANTSKAIQQIRKAVANGAQLMVLQELFNTLYFCQTVDNKHFEYAQPIPGVLTNELCDLAKELEVVIVAPFFERRAAGVYHNSLVVIDADGTLMGTYRKKHIPDDPGFYEKYYFAPGDDEYQVFDTRYAKIGPLICWDQWYPEAARIAALKGAEILLFPTAIATLPEENDPLSSEFIEAWQTIQRSHAIANGCFVAAVNRVGQESNLQFWGHSFVAGPFGKVLAEAGSGEEILFAEINLSEIETQRQIWPFLRDRRIDTYGPVMNRFIDS